MRDAVVKTICKVITPLGVAQSWAADVWRRHEWYSPFALIVWLPTRIPFCAGLWLACKVGGHEY